ncbi:hypothetical protein DFQ28_008485, partial [Apophysomyces sp. BC1034]
MWLHGQQPGIDSEKKRRAELGRVGQELARKLGPYWLLVWTGLQEVLLRFDWPTDRAVGRREMCRTQSTECAMAGSEAFQKFFHACAGARG